MKKLKKFYEYWFTGEVDARIEPVIIWVGIIIIAGLIIREWLSK